LNRTKQHLVLLLNDEWENLYEMVTEPNTAPLRCASGMLRDVHPNPSKVRRGRGGGIPGAHAPGWAIPSASLLGQVWSRWTAPSPNRTAKKEYTTLKPVSSNRLDLVPPTSGYPYPLTGTFGRALRRRKPLGSLQSLKKKKGQSKYGNSRDSILYSLELLYCT
jgi:hypothetical protein